MSEDRPQNPTGQNPGGDRTSERDSQLSAMFDGELSAAECELLARRLSRDEALRAQWSRYALIGAALRAERGVKLHDRVAVRVQAALAQEPTYGDSSVTEPGVAAGARAAAASSSDSAARVKAYERWLRFARPVAGAGIAAGVAAVSILWLRGQDPNPEMLASAGNSDVVVLQPEAASAPTTAPALVAEAQPARAPSNGEPERPYITPEPSSQRRVVPTARLANYVVAHSEYSSPLTRRMGLVGILGTETPAEGAEPDDQSGTAPQEPARVEVKGANNDAP